MSEQKICQIDDLKPNSMKRFRVGEKNVLLVRIKDDFFALEDNCSHEDFPLSDGFLDGDKVVCSMHAASFAIRTGEALTMPAFEDIETYSVRIDQNDVYVKVS